MRALGRDYKIAVWNKEYLGVHVVIDTETSITPFTETPTLATFQVYGGDDTIYYVPVNKVRLFLNKHTNSNLVFHNAPFDVDVIEKALNSRGFFFDFYDREKIYDTVIMYKLWFLATKGYIPHAASLAHIVKEFYTVVLDKEVAIRCNFADFINQPIESIPLEFLEYGAKDVLYTWQVYNDLLSRIRALDVENTKLSHHIQVKGDLALNRLYKRGIYVNQYEAHKMLKEKEKELTKLGSVLATYGWVRGIKGINERFEQICEFLGINKLLPRTEDGKMSSAEEDLRPYKDITFIKLYLDYIALEKEIAFITNIEAPKEVGDLGRVHPKYDLLKTTGRTGCSKPNFQNLPRGGGIRELFQAKQGNTFIMTDYSAVELATLAQVLYTKYGHSVMRDRINAGDDLHKYYSTIMHNCTMEEVTKEWRQQAKACNFGFPGGLGTETFIQFAKGYDLNITEKEADHMKKVWFKAFPEVKEYMQNGEGEVVTLTGRIRANTSYCAEKNTPFQGLAADGAKLALYNCEKAGLCIRGFVHDEIVIEASLEQADETQKLLENIMISSMQMVTPDVTIRVESQQSKHYCK